MAYLICEVYALPNFDFFFLHVWGSSLLVLDQYRIVDVPRTILRYWRYWSTNFEFGASNIRIWHFNANWRPKMQTFTAKFIFRSLSRTNLSIESFTVPQAWPAINNNLRCGVLYLTGSDIMEFERKVHNSMRTPSDEWLFIYSLIDV